MFSRIIRIFHRFLSLPERIKLVQESLGRIEARQTTFATSPDEAEFRVFSQWGEDGIIQYLINHVSLGRKIFVEFGVENYLQSNTRFLLSNNQWSGLVMDGSRANIEFIRRDSIYWASNLKAIHAFITKDNINSLLEYNGISGDIGLLSVDIDGNDYWVWHAINVISPRIVVCEYNSQFGPTAEITIPYSDDFVRDSAHFSKIYYGASISALTVLSASKGYSLVASNSAGNNVFYVRNDVLGDLKVLSISEAYVHAQFREFHDPHGNLTFDDFETRLMKIRDLPVYDIKRGSVVQLQELFATDTF